jgi:soluble lytic murein transglycosylase-like protein
VFLLCGVVIGAAHADIYVREVDGVPLYTDQPSGKSFALFMRTSDLPLNSQARRADARLIQQRMETYTPLVESAAQAAALEPALIHAVVMVESGYNADALSPKGARGLMQLMPDTARRFGTTDIHDPAQNLRGGARYLAQLIRDFDGQLPLALAAYNAGENAVRRHGGRIPPYAETQRYVPAVMSRYEMLRRKASSAT